MSWLLLAAVSRNEGCLRHVAITEQLAEQGGGGAGLSQVVIWRTQSMRKAQALGGCRTSSCRE